MYLIAGGIALFIVLVIFWPILRFAVYALALAFDVFLLWVAGAEVLNNGTAMAALCLPWAIIWIVRVTRAANGMEV